MTGEHLTGEATAPTFEESLAKLSELATARAAALENKRLTEEAYDQVRIEAVEASYAYKQQARTVIGGLWERANSGEIEGRELFEVAERVAQAAGEDSEIFRRFKRDELFLAQLQPGETVLTGSMEDARVRRLTKSPNAGPDVSPHPTFLWSNQFDFNFDVWVEAEDSEPAVRTTLRADNTIVGAEAIEQKLDEWDKLTENYYNEYSSDDRFRALATLVHSYRAIGRADKAEPIAEKARQLAVELIQYPNYPRAFEEIAYLADDAPDLLDEVYDKAAVYLATNRLGDELGAQIAFAKTYLKATEPGFHSLHGSEQNQATLDFLLKMNGRGLELAKQQAPETDTDQH